MERQTATPLADLPHAYAPFEHLCLVCQQAEAAEVHALPRQLGDDEEEKIIRQHG